MWEKNGENRTKEDAFLSNIFGTRKKTKANYLLKVFE